MLRNRTRSLLIPGALLGLTPFALSGCINPAILFQAALNTSVGTRPSASAVGDVNGDGIPDVVTANSGDATVSILIGNGNGTFQLQRTVAVGRNPRAIALADLDGDSKLDIITANGNDNTVSLLRGNGNGTFQPPTTLSVGVNPDSLAVGDLNSDGKPDLVTANAGDGTISLLINSGIGTFLPQSTVTVGSQPRSVVLVDLNGDGKLDILTPNYGNATLSVLLGNGNGAFTPAPTLPTDPNPLAVAVTDFNADGILDLVVANGSANLRTRLGNGDGTFQDALYLSGGNASSVAIANLNDDSFPDYAITDTANNQVSTIRGLQDGSAFDPVASRTGAGPVAVVLADLNGDGQPDIITTNAAGNSISVLLNNEGGANVSSQFSLSASAPKPAAGTGVYTQRVTLKNTGLNTFSGSLFLVLDNLTPNVTLATANGVTRNLGTLGSPYMRVYVPAGGLATGGSVVANLQFRNPSNRPINYSPRILAGGVQP